MAPGIPRSLDNTLAKLAKQQDRWNKCLNSKVLTLLYFLINIGIGRTARGKEKHLCHCLHIPTCSVNFRHATQHSVLMSYCICPVTPLHTSKSVPSLLDPHRCLTACAGSGWGFITECPRPDRSAAQISDSQPHMRSRFTTASIARVNCATVLPSYHRWPYLPWVWL